MSRLPSARVAAPRRVAAFVALAGLAASAFAFRGLPDLVPVHFGPTGAADGFAPRLVAALALPGAALGLLALDGLVLARLPLVPARRRAEAATRGPALLVASALLVGLHGVVLAAAYGRPSGEPRSLPALGYVVLGLGFAALGLVLPKLRRNAFAGVRTPWSLASDEAWARTHRVGGAAFFVGGLLAAALAAAGGGPVSVAALVGAALVPVAYSPFAARAAR